MRILVHGPSLGPADLRMRWSAAGLALRGHEVWWAGSAAGASPAAGPPPGVIRAPRGLGISRINADVVIGGSGAPRSTALAGWRTRAHCMVTGVRLAALQRWGPFDRWAWDSLYGLGLIEEAEAGALADDARGLDPGRLALWSAADVAQGPDAAHPDTEVLERACERALARHRGQALRPAVFLDRDGTLIVERGYLSDPAEIELLPDVPLALKNLRAAGYALIVVSNQSGVGRGLFPLERVYQAMAELRRRLRGHGLELDAIYFCPHRPDEGCACRKPAPGLLERAAEDLMLDLTHSFMIGDKRLDAATGRAASARGLLVRTGYGAEEAARLDGPEDGERPDHVSENLLAAARWVLAREDGAGG